MYFDGHANFLKFFRFWLRVYICLLEEQKLRLYGDLQISWCLTTRRMDFRLSTSLFVTTSTPRSLTASLKRFGRLTSVLKNPCSFTAVPIGSPGKAQCVLHQANVEKCEPRFEKVWPAGQVAKAAEPKASKTSM